MILLSTLSAGCAGATWPAVLAPLAPLAPEEQRQLESACARVSALADMAAVAHVKLLVDAEHTYFQPVGGIGRRGSAYDLAVQHMQRQQ
jgi:hypothetical protein